MTPAEFDRQLAGRMASFYNDPLGFVMFTFPWGREGTPLHRFPDGPEEWHREMFLALAQHVTANMAKQKAGEETMAWWSAVASGHGVGKSACVSWLILWLMSTRPYCRGVVTANTENQLTGKTWPELSKWHNLSINKHWHKWTASTFYSLMVPEEQRKSYCFEAIPWSEERSEGFAGLHNAGSTVAVIFDEASAISDKLFEVAEGALTDGEGFFFSFGNPTRSVGRFFEFFYGKFVKTMTFLKTVDSRTVRITNKQRLNAIIERYGPDHDVTRVRVLGQFPRGSLDGYIPFDLVDQAVHADLPDPPDHNAPLIMAVDAARFGEDDMVIRYRAGKDARSIPPRKWRKLDTMAAIDRIIEEIERYDPDCIVVEGGGPGAGVIDGLRRRHYRVIEFSPGAPTNDTRKFANKRAEMWSLLREWLHDGGCIDDDQKLLTDLTQIGFKFRESDGALQLESKREMKKRGLPSPDDGDALALTFAVKPPRRDANASRRSARSRGRIAEGADYPLFD